MVRLRELLRDLGLDRKKRMSLIEYLVVKYRVTIRELISRPQGTNVELARAQQALAAAQEEINKIETRKAQLEAAANGAGIKAMQAKNELAQLLSADPTDLNRALLTAEAAVRKAQKLGGEAQGASKRRISSHVVFDPFRSFFFCKPSQCLTHLHPCPGALWWIDRELTEMKKYKPQKSGGIARS